MSITNNQKVIQLYGGVAPGSENWNYTEKEGNIPFPYTYNISQPTLTAYLPDPSIANGTAIIICPGGGFFVLTTKNEGTEMADWFNRKGIAVFMLKYRLGESFTDNPIQELTLNMVKPDFADKMNEIVPLSVADGRAAITYLRTHAAEYGISPSRIGTLGFSAGGAVSAGVAINYAPENRPDFAAAIYSFIPPGVDGPVPADAPPLFLAAANDDPMGLAPKAAELYLKWQAARQKAELHIYEKGGHGFGMHKQHIPTDTWIERFCEWLDLQGVLKPM